MRKNKLYMTLLKTICTSILFSLTVVVLHAQGEIKKNIRVVKAYEPVISDAYKINVLPDMNDTAKPVINMSYNLAPRKMTSGFEPRPVRAADFKGITLSELYKSYARVGVGPYFLPYVEVGYNSLRSDDLNYSGNGFYHLSPQKIKLDNNKKVNASRSNAACNINATKIIKQGTIDGGIGFNRQSYHFYGYDSALVDTTLDKKDTQHNFMIFSVNAGFVPTPDSSMINYVVYGSYEYFRDKDKYIESRGELHGDLHMKYLDYIVGSGISFKAQTSDSVSQTRIELSPYLMKSTKDWTVKAGIRAILRTDYSTKFKLYPSFLFSYNAVDKVFIPYLQIDGYLQDNDYSSIVYENNYVKPGTLVAPTNHKIVTNIGVKGVYDSKTSYHVFLTYAIIDDMYFFVNDTLNGLGNEFAVIYDDVTMTKVSAQIDHRQSEKINVGFQANYYQYDMDNEAKAWHMPTFDAEVNARYNMQDKIFIKGGITGYGKRYAKLYNQTESEKVLKGYIAVNIGAEYKWSNVLTFFLQGYNITASKISTWNNYPEPRMMIMVGATYKL